MKRYRILMAMMLAFISANCAAETVMGEGTITCGSFLEWSAKFERGNVRDPQLSWALGFLSALNLSGFYQKDILKQTDDAAVKAAIKLYCEKNPLDNLRIATIKVADQLAAKAGSAIVAGQKK